MIRLQQNRYLWLHLAGLGFVPLLLDICLAGLASAGPALAFQGQFWAIALLTITPALAMQWFKPFYVFSLPPVALKPAALSSDQRRCLQIFQSWQIKALAIVVAAVSVWLLAQLYSMSPQVSPMLSAKVGVVSAAIAFFLASTSMQISVSAARALLVSPTALKRVAAVDESAIAANFLIAGIRVNKLLPNILDQPNLEPNELTQPIINQNSTEVESSPVSIATKGNETAVIPLSAQPIEIPEASADESDELETIVPETILPEEVDDLPV